MAEKLDYESNAVDSAGLIDFQEARVVPGFDNGTFFLVVSGTKPCVNMTVELQPLIYVACPEYWGIQLIGRLKGGICLPEVAPFTEAIPLAGITGSKGIEVIGASKSKNFEVTGGCS